MTWLASMAPLATLAIHWCKWPFICFIDTIDANGTNDSSGVMDFNVPWRVWNVKDTSPFNGANNPTGAFVAIGIIVAIGTIVWPMYHHCLQWIVIVTIGANVATVSIGHHWCHQHRHEMMPMEPFKWRHWSPIVIVISANDDRHRHQWRWGAPLALFDPSPLVPMDRHYHHFCRHSWCKLRQWWEFQTVMTLLYEIFQNLQ